MKKSVGVLIAVSLVVAGCAKQSSQKDAVAVTAEARKVLDSVSDSLRAKGLMGWISFLHNSPDFSWEFNGVQTSYDSLIAGERAQAPLYRSIAMTWDSVKAESVADNAMHLSAKFSEALAKADGSGVIVKGRVDCRLERIAGTWKFTRGKTFDY